MDILTKERRRVSSGKLLLNTVKRQIQIEFNLIRFQARQFDLISLSLVSMKMNVRTSTRGDDVPNVREIVQACSGNRFLRFLRHFRR